MSGLAEHWQRADESSPFSQVTVNDGNQLTILPVVDWPCRGGVLSVGLTLFHNADDTPDQMPPPPLPEHPPLGHGWSHSYLTNLFEDPASGDVTITEGDGREHLFTKNPDQSYTHPTGIFETLVKNLNGSFTLTRHGQVKWQFDSAGQLTSIEDLNSNTIGLGYNASGQLGTVTDPSSQVLSFAYDADGFLTSVTDSLNRVFTFNYNGTPKHLWQAHEPNPSPYFVEIGYGPLEKVGAVIDQRGRAWEFRYYEPPDQRLYQVWNPDGNNLTYEYPSASRTDVTDENNNQTHYHHGGQGEVSQIDRYPVPQGPSLSETFVYDAQLNVTSITKPKGDVWENTWDANGNLLTLDDPITRTDPNLHRAEFTYNSANRPTTAKDASGHVTNYDYDANQNLTKVTDAAGIETTYGYDSFGNRTSQVVNGKTTTLGYDGNGNLNSLTDPLGNQTQSGYNALGWRTYSIDAQNRTTHYDHDPMGQVKLVTYPDFSTIDFDYDPNGNRILMNDATGTTTWEYSDTNLVTSENNGPDDSIGYTYDYGGRVTRITDQAGEAIDYEYDGMNRLTKAHRGLIWEATYQYDDNSNLTDQTSPNGTTVTRGYNAADWLTSVVNQKSDGTVLSSFNYDYNVDGLRSKVTEYDGSQVAYGYDALHQLTSEIRTGTNPYNLSFEYDAAGNRTKMIKDGVTTNYTYDDANRLLSANGTTYGWDANGNQTSKTVGGQTTNFGYDYDDQLISISGATNVDFTYDGLGRRASRKTGGVTTDFFYDGQRMTTEKQFGSTTAHYLYGKSLLSRDDGTDYEYYLVDGLGSTRQLTDATESVTADYLFEGFGQLVSQSGSAVNPYQFAGSWRYRNDGDAGLLHVGARYYDPEVGRFITADVVLGDIWNPQSLNRYVYVSNNPVNFVDPSGHGSWVLVAVLLVLGIIVYVWVFRESKATIDVQLDKIIRERNAATMKALNVLPPPRDFNASSPPPKITNGISLTNQRYLLRGGQKKLINVCRCNSQSILQEMPNY